MKITIKNLDPTGVAIESEEVELPIIVERTKENGYYEEVQPNGIVFQYEPMMQNRYYMEIGGYLYKINDRTGELTLIKKGED